MRLYNKPFKIGARAYRIRDRQPIAWHPGPVQDAEAFCRKLLDDAFDSWGMFLRPEFYDDSLADLIIILQRCEAKYDPGRTDTFERYSRWIISQRAVDVGPRRVLGRNGSRINDYLFDELETTIGDRLVEDLGAWEGDQTEDCGRDARWLHPDYDRARARADAILGL